MQATTSSPQDPVPDATWSRAPQTTTEHPRVRRGRGCGGVGANVVDFKIDDEVFGEAVGSCAEYVCTSPDKLVHKPEPEPGTRGSVGRFRRGGTSRHQGCRKGLTRSTRSHQRCIRRCWDLRVQIAKALGAEVTGVCSTPNVDLVRSIGADHVIDYTQEDFTQAGPRYDLILDNVANHPLSRIRYAAVASGGKL